MPRRHRPCGPGRQRGWSDTTPRA